MALSREMASAVDRMSGKAFKKLQRCGFGVHLLMGCLLGTAGGQSPERGAAAGAAADSDHDGLSDAMEQALLTRFLPRFQVSAGECDEQPAEFASGELRANPVRRDGTIYGQVTPRGVDARGRALIEVHYYDLWGKDCGRKGHALDAEHVAVLLSAREATASAAQWTAAYWFAAAHEATMCDMSQVATGAALGATDHGPEVWISRGKHAAYLAAAICNGGCGADRCEQSEAFAVAKVVNLGEATAPMNEAVWVNDPRWPLLVKMSTDFPPEAMARLERQDLGEPVLSNGAHGSVRGTIFVANATYGDLATSAGNTAGALGTAGDDTADALTKSRDKTVHALGRSARNVGGALRRAGRSVVPGRQEPTPETSK